MTLGDNRGLLDEVAMSVMLALRIGCVETADGVVRVRLRMGIEGAVVSVVPTERIGV